MDELSTREAPVATIAGEASGRETGTGSGVEMRRTNGRRWRRDSPTRLSRANGAGLAGVQARRRADHHNQPPSSIEYDENKLLDVNPAETFHKSFEATREQISTSLRKSQPVSSRRTPNRKHNTQHSTPVLIHTDTMNASSPLLYVRQSAVTRQQQPSASQEQSRQQHQHQHQLMAEGAAPLPAWLDKQGVQPRAVRAQAPKIVIHQLQVNSTTVTLTWMLTTGTPSTPDETQLAPGTGRHDEQMSSNTRDTLGGGKTSQQPPHQQREHVPADCGAGNLGGGPGGGAVRQRRQVDRTDDFRRRRGSRYPDADESGSNNKALNTGGGGNSGDDDDEDDHTKGAQNNRTTPSGSSLDTPTDGKQQRHQLRQPAPEHSSNGATGEELAAAGGSISLPGDNSRNLQSYKAQQHMTNTTESQAARNSHQSATVSPANPQPSSSHQASSSDTTRRPAGRRRLTGNRHSTTRDELPVIKTLPVSLNRLPPSPTASTDSTGATSSGGSGGASSNDDKHKRTGKSIPKLTPNHSEPLFNTSSTKSILVEQTSSSPQQHEHQESTTTTTATATTTIQDIASLRTTTTTSPPRLEVDTGTGEWLVRLRRFGSEELDIVQIVARNLSRTLSGPKQSNIEEPQLRHIVFKDLEPDTGYEICVESPTPVSTGNASNNQQQQDVDDKYQILDANQFSTLKCNDPRLTNSSSSSTQHLASNLTSFQQQRSLCKEFFTLPANSNSTLIFGGGGRGETSGQIQKPQPGVIGSSAAVNETIQSILRKPKSLNNAIRNRMELLEITDNQLGGNRDLNLFEVHVSHPRLENARFLNNELVTPLSTEGSPTIRKTISATSNQDFLSLSVLPIVGCIFGLIFIVTLANVILSAINCRSSPQPTNSKKGGGKRGKRRHPDLGSFYSGSNVSGTSQSRMVVVGGKNSEPFAISSGYFEVPSAQPSSSTSPTSNYLLARFPLGSSFDGDESHNADMVGLARKNYDNFIYNMYNSSQSAADLSSMRKQPTMASRSPGSYAHISLSGQKHRHQHRRDIGSPQVPENDGVEYSTAKGNPSEGNQCHQSSASDQSSKAKQRVRYDKINPIYNMEQYSNPTSGTGRARWPPGLSSFGHSNQAMVVEDEQYPSHTAAVDSLQDTTGQMEDCELCQRESSIATYLDQPFTCCLDKQKQRFEKQQQQLERVLTKNGSLVPQPFIHPIEPEPSNCQLPYSAGQPVSLESVSMSNTRRDSVESQLNKGDQELQLTIGNESNGISKYSANELMSPIPQQRQVNEVLLHPPPPPSPLPAEIQLPNSSADHQAMKKSDFDQRRNELASKLYLNGMTKLKA